ncbi:MAG: type II toxin-antitoxin system CcdA family antitoxin [Candidatus Njordarchaeia archaeon]
MPNYVVVSGKIPKALKEKIKKLGININRVIRRALEEEVKRREEALLKESIENAAEILRKIDTKRIVKSIREDRESR